MNGLKRENRKNNVDDDTIAWAINCDFVSYESFSILFLLEFRLLSISLRHPF